MSSGLVSHGILSDASIDNDDGDEDNTSPSLDQIFVGKTKGWLMDPMSHHTKMSDYFRK